MIYVSFIEIFFKARDTLVGAFGEPKGTWLTVLAFFGCIFLVGIIAGMMVMALSLLLFL